MFSPAWKVVGKKGRRRVLGLQKRQRMLADPEIPIRMADPGDIEIILKPERRSQIGPANQLIENHAVINSLDPTSRPSRS